MSWLNIAVVGGVNLDILGFPRGVFRPRDSLIGRVRFACGGVGHNIAAQAVRTGADVSLYTVTGDDWQSEWLRQACLEEGIRLDHAARLRGPSSTYLAIHNEDGDMLAAVNDMALLDSFTPDLLDAMLPYINAADVCALDANLPEESLAHLAEGAAVPLVCDPVSDEKAARIVPLLPRLTALKPNLQEARAMTGMDTPEACARHFLAAGTKMAFISLGKDGLYFADAHTQGYLRPTALSTRPQTGAGDALAAGITAGVAQRLSAGECAALGMKTVSAYLNIT